MKKSASIVAAKRELYEVWDDDVRQPITFELNPPSSRLFRLTPIGTGTEYVESMSSYLSRLAQAHSVSLGQLMTAEILPLLTQASDEKLGGLEPKVSLQNVAKVVNGLDPLTETVIKAVSKLTLQNDLQLLTLLPYASMLATKNLTRPYKAWCNLCCLEWQETGQPLYEPLLWQLALLNRCPRHYVPLQKQCPNCGKTQPLFAAFTRSGYCSYCSGQLFARQEVNETNNQTKMFNSINEVVSGFDDEWVSEQLMALIRALPICDRRTGLDDFRQSVLQLVRQPEIYGIQVVELLKAADISTTTLQNWGNGERLPCLAELFTFCHTLKQKSVLSLLRQGLLTFPEPEVTLYLKSAQEKAVAAAKVKISKTKPRTGKKLAFTKVYNKLQKIAEAKTVPTQSLAEIAAEVGYANEKQLQKDFPQLTRKIAATTKKRRSDFSDDKVQMEAILQRKENPPPSMQVVAQRLGRSQNALQRHFPKEYAAIVERHKHFRKERQLQKEAQKVEAIRQSVQELAKQGVYPSSNKVGQLIGDNRFMFKEVLAAAWRENLKTSGY